MNRTALILAAALAVGCRVESRTHLYVETGPVTAVSSAPYHRPRWSHPEHSCRDTRAVLLAQRCASVTWDPKGCRVREATCLDVYTGVQVSTDTAAQSLQIDHLLPASQAWRRRTWNPGEFEAYFNDPDNLIVTRSRTNDQKGELMPSAWCPRLRGARMLAATRLRRVADRYHIPLTEADEAGLLAWQAGECATGSRILGEEVSRGE